MAMGRLVLGAALVGGWVTSTRAAILSLACITWNDTTGESCGIAAEQLSVEITETAVGTALFTFSNIGDGQATVGEIYFDADAALAGIVGLDFGSYGTVSFSEGARPANLPGGRQPQVYFSADYSLGADNPSPFKGLNNGTVAAHETLDVEFALNESYDALLAGLADGSVRIGVHVKAFEGGYSESLVNVSAVPVPASALLIGSGLLGLAGVARRRT